MWIKGFHMDGFGIFRDTGIQDLSPRLTVLLGDNEAGKSTTLDFFRTMFFGFPRRNAAGRRLREPLAGGTHGGRLFLADGGRDIQLRRTPGSGGGTVTLTAADGTPLPEAELTRLLGSMTEGFFCNVHAFGLDELQLVGRDSDEILAQLYGAGSGAGKSLAAAEKLFEKRSAERFSSGGQKPAINQLLKKFEDLDQRLREARAEAGEYAVLDLRAKELGERLKATLRTHGLLAQRQRLLEAVRACWPDWVEVEAAETRLAELPEVPSDTPERGDELDRLTLDLRTAAEDCTKRLDEREETAAELAATAVDPALAEAREDIRTLARQTGEHRAACQRLPALESEIGQAREALAAHLRQLGPDWTEERVRACDRSVAVREELANFTRDLARAEQEAREADAENQRRAAEQRQAGENQTRAEAELVAAQAAAARFPAAACEPLRRDRDLLARLAQDLPERKRERDDLHRQAADLARRVDPAWTLEQIRAFDTSAGAEERLRQAADHSARSEQELATAQRDLAQAEEQLAAAEPEDGTDPVVLRQHLRELAKAQAAREALAEWSATPGWLPVLVAGIVLVALAVAVHWLFWLGLPLLGVAWRFRPAGRVTVRRQALAQTVREHAAALGLDPEKPDVAQAEARIEQSETARRRAAGLAERETLCRRGLEQARRERAEAEHAWTEQALALGFAQPPPPATVQRLVTTIAEAQRLLADADRMDERIAVAQTRLAAAWQQVREAKLLDHPPATFAADLLDQLLAEQARCEQARREAAVRLETARQTAAEQARRLAEAEAASKQAAARFEELRESWRGWLGGHGFQATLAPDTAREALGILDQAWERSQGLAKLLAERQRLDAVRAEFLARTEALFAKLGRSAVPSEERAAAVDDLLAESEENDRNQTTRNALQKQLDKAEKTLIRAAERQEQARAVLAALLARHGAESEGELREQIAYAEQRRLAAETRRQGLRNLQTALGTTDEASVRTIFSDTDQAGLPEEIDALAAEVRDLQESAESLRNERAQVLERMARLASSDEIARLRQEQEAVRAEMEAEALDWSRAMLAKRLLDAAKATFERERQPQVLKEASEYFRLLTNGRYAGIFSPLGGDRPLQARREDGESRTPDQLSRGTVEQLYLALRFGFLADSARKGMCLPVLMDEILVNFDPSRSQAAARAIGRLAETQQILYFTCHPGVAELFAASAPGTRVVLLAEEYAGR
ncbi:MAG: AAA family ATPase [Lentisphaeria bacterium]|jgi:uncharacterized protein YhaN|nr:AAA family ATPase [Lentisphaeria bacterium]